MRRLVLTLPIGETTCQDCPFLAPDWSAAMGHICTTPHGRTRCRTSWAPSATRSA